MLNYLRKVQPSKLHQTKARRNSYCSESVSTGCEMKKNSGDEDVAWV